MDARNFIRKQVFDPVQRVLHWWIGATVIALVILAWTEKSMDLGLFKQSLTQIHIVLGFALSIGFLLRCVWGFIGPKQAHFKVLWQSTRGLAETHSKFDNERFGYERIAGSAYIFLYLLLACAVLSGLILAGMRYDQGPLATLMFDNLSYHELVLIFHNTSLYGVTIFIFAHITGMIRHEKSSGLPVAQSMVSGYQYRTHRENGVSDEHQNN